MGKASRAKQERREAEGARTMEETLTRLRSLKLGEVLIKSFYLGLEAETVATTPIMMAEAALRCDDRMGLIFASLGCDMVGQSMLDFAFPNVAGFFSDGEGSIYDAAFYYGAGDCLRFLCQEGFVINHAPLFSIAKRAYWLIDDLSLHDPNYLPVSVVVEAYLREMVRRIDIAASKAHVATPNDDGLVCQRAMLMLGVIEEEFAGATPSQTNPASSSEPFAAQS